MITSNIRYPFDRKVAMVETTSFNCMIKTSKDGLFTKQSTKFSVFGEGMVSRRHIAKLLFNDRLDPAERLRLHDIIVGLVDEAGTNGKSLGDTLRELFEDFELKDLDSWKVISLPIHSSGPSMQRQRTSLFSPSSCTSITIPPRSSPDFVRKRNSIFPPTCVSPRTSSVHQWARPSNVINA